MPFTTRNFNHLPPPTQFSAGPTSGLFENLGASFRRQREIESAFGFEVDLRNSYRKSLERAAELSGEDMSMGWWNALEGIGAGARREAGADPYSGTPFGRGTVDDYLRDIDDRDRRIAELKKQDPSLRTFKEIFEEEKKRRAELIGETDLTAARAGVAGTIGGFLGSVFGSFDPERDPLLFSTLGIPLGAGGSIARRMLMEAVLGAGTEGLQQQLFVNPKHKMLGEEKNNVVAAMLFAAVGGAAFRGALEGAPIAFRAAERRIDPQRAAARIIAEEFERVHGRPLDVDRLPKRLTNEQLSRAVDEVMPQSHSAWSVRATLANERLTAEASPYNLETRFGRLQTEEAVDAARREFEGLEPVETPGARLVEEQTTPQPLTRQLDEIEMQITDLERQVDTPRFVVEEPEAGITRTRTQDVEQFGQVHKLSERKWVAELRDNQTGDVKRRAGTHLTKKKALKKVESMLARLGRYPRLARLENELFPLQAERIRLQTALDLEKVKEAEQVRTPATPDNPARAVLDEDAIRWRAIVEELDARSAPDSAYREILSSGSKDALKKGETWRGRVLKTAEAREARVAARLGERPPAQTPEDLQRTADEFVPEDAADAATEQALASVGRDADGAKIEVAEGAEPPPPTVPEGMVDLGPGLGLVRGDLELLHPVTEKPTTARALIEEIGDDEALLKAAKECGI